MRISISILHARAVCCHTAMTYPLHDMPPRGLSTCIQMCESETGSVWAMDLPGKVNPWHRKEDPLAGDCPSEMADRAELIKRKSRIGMQVLMCRGTRLIEPLSISDCKSIERDALNMIDVKVCSSASRAYCPASREVYDPLLIPKQPKKDTPTARSPCEPYFGASCSLPEQSAV